MAEFTRPKPERTVVPAYETELARRERLRAARLAEEHRAMFEAAAGGPAPEGAEIVPLRG